MNTQARFAWEVNGQSASIGCPSINATVTVRSTATPGGASGVQTTSPCANGLIEIDDLPAGDWVFEAELVDGTSLATNSNIPMTVVEGAPDIVIINFTF